MQRMDDTLKMLAELTEAPGVPGDEGEVRRVIRRHLEPLATIERDNLGSIIGRKQGAAERPRIMLAGHMDEIAFMVTKITKDGFLKFIQLGGWPDQVLLAQRVTIRTRKGDVPGIIGSKPPHVMTREEREKLVKKEKMFIDIGATSDQDARDNLGVEVGDPIIPVSPFTVMKNPKFLMAKAWDDRIGCAMFIEILKRLQALPHPNTVYGVGTVQEEVGLRGAKTSAYTVDPDVGFALEVDIASDTPGKGEDDPLLELGKGPTVVLYDASMVPHLKLRNLVLDTAREQGIPVQFSALPGGGTDAGRIHLHGSGVPSLVVSVATRYIHSHAGIIHRDDFENAVRLLVSVIMKLDARTVEELKS